MSISVQRPANPEEVPPARRAPGRTSPWPDVWEALPVDGSWVVLSGTFVVVADSLRHAVGGWADRIEITHNGRNRKDPEGTVFARRRLETDAEGGR